MNKLLFPFQEDSHYDSISSKQWEILEKTFAGFPVKRVFALRLFGMQNIGDNLTKA
jgi:hypothetical protein